MAQQGKTEVFLKSPKNLNLKRQILNDNYFLKKIELKECEAVFQAGEELVYNQGDSLEIIEEVKDNFFIILSGFIEVYEDNTQFVLGGSDIIGLGNFVNKKHNYQKINALTNAKVSESFDKNYFASL